MILAFGPAALPTWYLLISTGPICSRSTALNLLVYAAQGSDVTMVIVNGKIVVRDRRLLTFDHAPGQGAGRGPLVDVVN